MKMGGKMKKIHQRMLLGLQAVCENQGDGWFIIMEEPETESFVQFAFDEGEGLVFDCPTMSFNPEELENAIEVMARFGISHENPSGDDFSSFNAAIGMDVELAAQIATAMFCEVFKFDDDLRFDITINR